MKLHLNGFSHSSYLKAFALQCNSNIVVKKVNVRWQRHYVLTLQTLHQQSDSHYRLAYQSDNGKIKYKIHKRHTVFGKAGRKVTRSTIWFDPFFSFLSTSASLIGSDCPSQSRDAMAVTMEPSSASARRRADNVSTVFSKPLLTTSVRRLQSTRGTSDNQYDNDCMSSQIQIWLNCLTYCNSKMLKRELRRALVCLWGRINVYIQEQSSG